MKNDALNLCNPFIFGTRGKVLSFIMVYQDYTIENDQCLCAANIEREGDEFERIPPSISLFSIFARNKLSLKALYWQKSKSLKENANLVKWQICSLPRENSKISTNSPLRVFSPDISESTCLSHQQQEACHQNLLLRHPEIKERKKVTVTHFEEKSERLQALTLMLLRAW